MAHTSRLPRLAGFIVCGAIVSGTCTPAAASHPSGIRNDVLGFSNEATFLIRTVDVQHGVVAHEIRALAGGGRLLLRPFDPEEDVVAVEGMLRSEHGIVAPLLPGNVAPDRNAAVVVVPGPVGRTHSFSYDVRLQDGSGVHSRAQLSVPHTCAPEVGGSAAVTVYWSPDSSTAVLAGAISVEDPCGEPTLNPVLEIIEVGPAANPVDLQRLAIGLEERVRALAPSRPAEAELLGRQLLMVAPKWPEVRVRLARLRASRGDERGALALLWSIVSMPNGFSLLADVLGQDWTHGFSARASWQALQWVVEEHRLSFGPPLFDTDWFIGPPWLNPASSLSGIPTSSEPPTALESP